MSGGEDLAERLEAANRDLAALIEGLTDEEWGRHCANAPGWSYGEDERRTIAQVALHVANQHLVQAEIVAAVGQGRPPALSNPGNEEEAAANPAPAKDRVLALLEENCRAGAAVLRALSDEQLGRSTTFRGWTMTARELAEQNQVGHLLWHAAGIRASLSGAPGTPRRPSAS